MIHTFSFNCLRWFLTGESSFSTLDKSPMRIWMWVKGISIRMLGGKIYRYNSLQLQLCFTTLQQIASNLTNSMTSTQSTVAPTSSSSIFSLSSQSSASGSLVSNAAIPTVVTTSSAGASMEGSMRKSINLIHYCTFEERGSLCKIQRTVSRPTLLLSLKFIWYCFPASLILTNHQ